MWEADYVMFLDRNKEYLIHRESSHFSFIVVKIYLKSDINKSWLSFQSRLPILIPNKSTAEVCIFLVSKVATWGVL